MGKLALSLLFALSCPQIQSQGITGSVVDSRNMEPLPQVKVKVLGRHYQERTDVSGNFILPNPGKGDFILVFELTGYETRQYPVTIDHQRLDLGRVRLETERQWDNTGPIVTLDEAELESDTGSAIFGFLDSGRDVFLRRAAFDFSQVFYRLRGYDSRETEILLNGFTMNSLFDGRPQWNHWGGLNDVTRNQDVTYGMQASGYTFGGLLGNVYIDTHPTGMRPGYRFSGAASNRTYSGRLMATYVSGNADKPLQYAFSASRRWAEQGFIDGTLYDSWAAFATAQYAFGSHNQLSASVVYASSRRGRSAAITDEVASILGTAYNPYWGYHDGAVRNSRERNIREPLVQLKYAHEGDRSGFEMGVMYQSGKQSNSRLGYFNAPSPDPVYYRYLPSYSINNPVGANFLSASMARTALAANPQLNWDLLYQANSQGKASYLLYDDITENSRMQFFASANIATAWKLRIDSGIRYRSLHSSNYGRIVDMLGAEYHEDIDPFSDTSNDADGAGHKMKGAKIGYNYDTSASLWQSFLQMTYEANSWEAMASIDFSGSNFRREGLFRNERYPGTSVGAGKMLAFTAINTKAGFSYHYGGRHWFEFHAGMGKRPPLLKYAYVNPRESNEAVPSLRKESIHGFEFNYHLRLPQCMARLSSYYSRIMDKTDIHFFYADSGVGSDFVQEVRSGVDELRMGLELGLEYEFSPTVKASLATSAGKYLYASDPLVTINFDTSGTEGELISTQGNLALGAARMKDLRLAAGPQRALAIGLEYRDPHYWWAGFTANYLSRNYISPSALIRTESFTFDPDSGLPLPGATVERLSEALLQESLESVYLLNMTAGKSWLHNGMYISLFASVANIFDSRFRTGGYEQSRNGNFAQWSKDNLSGSPSFGPKYWYGYGRTFFVSTALSF